MQSCAMTEIMILAGATLRKMRQEVSRGPIYIQKSPQRKLGDDDLYPLVVAKGHECDISTQQALCKVVSTLEALLYVTGYAPFFKENSQFPRQGDYIDAKLGLAMGLSTMAAAAWGNTFRRWSLICRTQYVIMVNLLATMSHNQLPPKR